MQPVAKPSAAAIPAERPCATPRVRTYTMSGPGAIVSSAEAARKSGMSGTGSPTKKPRTDTGLFRVGGRSRQACTGSIDTVRFLAGPRVWYFTRPVAVAKSV